MDGIEACDTASILEQQHRDILDHYKPKLKDGLDIHDEDEQQLKDMNPRTRFVSLFLLFNSKFPFFLNDYNFAFPYSPKEV